MPNIGTPPWTRRRREWKEGIEKRFQDGEISREQADIELNGDPQETQNWLKEKGEDILCPKCPYPLRPEYQGKLVWLTGAPGSGKSTTALLLAKHKGFVYYEMDCFDFVMNPFIPANTDDDQYTLMKNQNPLVGKERAEREELVRVNEEIFDKWLAGKEMSEEDLKIVDARYKCLGEDIKRERKRVGGDWVIAGCATTKDDRDYVRKYLGPDLLMIIMHVDKETVGPRLKKRHEGEDDEVGEDGAEYLGKLTAVVEDKFPEEKNTEEIQLKGNESKEEVIERVNEVIENHFKKSKTEQKGGNVENVEMDNCKCLIQ